jgi:hypothetical protein
MPWTECELESDNEESRIPLDVLEISDAETVFKNHINVLQQEQKRLEYDITVLGVWGLGCWFLFYILI